MNWVDYTIIGLIVLSCLIGIARGFVREGFSLFFWIVAFWLGFTYSSNAAAMLKPYIEHPQLRVAVAFLIIFIIVLIIGAIIGTLLTKLVKKTGLSGTDRLLGLIFGFLRGVLLIALVLLLAKATNMGKNPAWQQSSLIPHFKGLVDWLQSLLPSSVTQYLSPEKAKAAAAHVLKTVRQ